MAMSLNQSFLSPVKFSPYNSPAPKSSNPVAQRTTLIINKIVSNHELWQEEQKQGLVICNKIERVKRKVLDSSSTKTETFYPDELIPLCDKLNRCIANFRNILQYCTDSRKHLEALRQLDRYTEDPIFRSWCLDDFLHFVDEMRLAYEAEIENKIKVCENISHSPNSVTLTLHICVWEYPKTFPFLQFIACTTLVLCT